MATTFYQIKHFDQPIFHHPVDDIEPIESPQSALAEALVRIVIWQTTGISAGGIAARTLVLSESLSLNPKALTWAEIAEHTGITRQAVDLMARELEDQFKLRSNNARNDTTRERCKLAQYKFHDRKTK
jgi:hypothetical protein